jgi:cytosine/uracil/thiamine/allantoin permease
MALGTIGLAIFSLALMIIATVIAANIKKAQGECKQDSLNTAHKWARNTAITFGVIAGLIIAWIVIKVAVFKTL